MKLFGNSRRNRSRTVWRDELPVSETEQELSAQSVQELDTEASLDEPKPVLAGNSREASVSPQKSIFYFCAALCVFVGVLVMCLLLIQKSGAEADDTPADSQVNALKYTVGSESNQSGLPSDVPGVTLTAPQSVNDSSILNLLLICPEETAERTDTVMLLRLDLSDDSMALLSLPRDTYISGNYEMPKLQEVYYSAKGGQRGAKALKETVKEMIGFWPDYYFVLDQQTMSLLVAQTGGVLDFKLPASADYCELSAGTQSLTGANALKVLQYRDDYTEIETESTEIQRDFILSLLEQVTDKTEDVLELASQLSSVAETDLSEGDLAFLIQFFKNANLSKVYSTCLSGETVKVTEGNVFQVDLENAVKLLNEWFNPLEDELTVYGVNFRQKTGSSSDGTYSPFGFPSASSSSSEEEPEPSDSSDSGEEPSSTEAEPTPSDTEAPTEPPTTQAPTDPPTELQPSEG